VAFFKIGRDPRQHCSKEYCHVRRGATHRKGLPWAGGCARRRGRQRGDRRKDQDASNRDMKTARPDFVRRETSREKTVRKKREF